MKRMFILVAIALFAAGSLFAEEAVLIDFTKLAADIIPNQDNVPTQNRATMMDFSNVAGGSFTTSRKARTAPITDARMLKPAAIR